MPGSDSDGNGYGNSYTYTDVDANSHSNSYAYTDVDTNGHSNSHGNFYCYCRAEVYAVAQAATHATSTPISSSV